ncbi:transposase [Dysgonomonas sp. PH5-45]|uniref:ISAon1 family transposase n=1 Tax=unclassified Dysgonomonas TaxID=2630389 RepID=UPI002476D0A2|nr:MULTISPECIES: transposase [unclassified Dysgonomonas]MDH6356141.1 transposase [Dysgonomonas sp. PH5-45]MDH6389035.1 transposase [Dysgonomonas sp. PH5-37]
MNGQTLRKQYKEVISDYRVWDQLDHAEEYILFEENLGADLSLDETCMSNGEVYTVLTNKAAHGREHSLVAMVRGVSSQTVIKAFKRMSRHKRLQVKSITTDLSSAMMLTARRSFPKAELINDRFHVQQLMNEAVDQIRIKYRWEVLDAENKAIREYRKKRKEAKQQGCLLEPWEPTRMSNGETMPQIMARSKHIILKHFSKWNEQQKIRAQILFEAYPKLKQGYELSIRLTQIFNKQITANSARLLLAKWYNEVEKFGETGLNRVLETFENHNQTIINYFNKRLTNASAESFNAKIKAFRSQFRGVGDIKFFMYRLAMLYS